MVQDGLGMSPARMGLWMGFSKLPWLIKPVWGFLTDAFPIAGYRRRSWLIIVNLTGVARTTRCRLLRMHICCNRRFGCCDQGLPYAADPHERCFKPDQ